MFLREYELSKKEICTKNRKNKGQKTSFINLAKNSLKNIHYPLIWRRSVFFYLSNMSSYLLQTA